MRMKLVIACILLIAGRAAADPAPVENPCPDPGCHVKGGGVLATPKGKLLLLPPGYYLDEPTWMKRDADLKDAQDKVTRLDAENKSFRESAAELHWKTPVVAFGLGIIAGVVLVHYL